MIYLIEKSNILDKLANILHSCLKSKYDNITCNYEYIYETISTSISYDLNGETFGVEVPFEVPFQNLELCLELRELMKSHKGEEWDSFTLTLDADGKAHTKFHYPDVAS